MNLPAAIASSNGRPKCLVRLFFLPSYYRESKFLWHSYVLWHKLNLLFFATASKREQNSLFFIRIHQLRELEKKTKITSSRKLGDFFKLPSLVYYSIKRKDASLYFFRLKKFFLVSTFARGLKNFFKLLLLHFRFGTQKTMKNTEEKDFSVCLLFGTNFPRYCIWQSNGTTILQITEEQQKVFFRRSSSLEWNFFQVYVRK